MSNSDNTNDFEPIRKKVVRSESSNSLISLLSIESFPSSNDLESISSSKSYENLNSLNIDKNTKSCIYDKVVLKNNFLDEKKSDYTVSFQSQSKSYDSLKEIYQDCIDDNPKKSVVIRRKRDNSFEVRKSPQVKDVLKYLTELSISPTSYINEK